MKTAYYMNFIEPTGKYLDRVGGTPTHLPAMFPICRATGQEMAFLCQFYSDPVRLPLRDSLCIQLYQCADPDEGEDPQPMVVALPNSASLNVTGIGTPAKGVTPYEICWEPKEEPDAVQLGDASDISTRELFQSKMGGVLPFQDVLPKGAVGIMQLTEYPSGFNFAGLMLVVFRNRKGALSVRLV